MPPAIGLGIRVGLGAQARVAEPAFAFTIDTRNTSTGSTASNQFKLPILNQGAQNFRVDWGDGSSDTITAWNAATTTHTYAVAGIYSVQITGTICGWAFANTGDRLKILNIASWGPLKLTTGGSAFYSCSNLTVTATDTPDLSGVTNLTQTFRNCGALTGLGGAIWPVGSVQNFSFMFRDCPVFNGDVAGWNVSNGTNFSYMFYGAAAFNRDVSGWSVGQSTTFEQMFRAATAFNRSLGAWDIRSASNLNQMFQSAGLSVATYDAILIGWAARSPLQSGAPFGAGVIKYSTAAAAARNTLASTWGWTITDGGPA